MGARRRSAARSPSARAARSGCATWRANPALEGFTLPKVLWLRNHEPARVSRGSPRCCWPKDYIRYRLTGTLATEPSDASAHADVRSRRACAGATSSCAAVDVSRALAPRRRRVVRRCSAASRADAARLTGLPAGTPVVGGGADNACGAAGVGVDRAGRGGRELGNVGHGARADGAAAASIPGCARTRSATSRPDIWYLMGVVLSAGGAFAWYRDQFCARARRADRRGRQRSTRRRRSVPPGAEGVTFLPYLQGERTPHRDASARGAFLGLSLAHTRAHLTRAVLEGVCFALRDSRRRFCTSSGLRRASCCSPAAARRARSSAGCRPRSSALPVTTVNREEGPAYGAALLAAVGAGAFPDLAAAARATLSRAARSSVRIRGARTRTTKRTCDSGSVHRARRSPSRRMADVTA